jgi:hypothetical protein
VGYGKYTVAIPFHQDWPVGYEVTRSVFGIADGRNTGIIGISIKKDRRKKG